MPAWPRPRPTASVCGAGDPRSDARTVGAVIYFDTSAEPLAREIAQRLPDGFALASGVAPDRGWYLFVDKNGLMLRESGNRSFLLSGSPSGSPPVGRPRPRKSALARACDAGTGLRVLDATAGWGTDGLALARLGCHVRMLESNPQVFAMLDDRLRRRSGVRAATEWADARSRMRSPDKDRYDVIYLDPMFPPRNKTALPARPLQVLREIVGGRDARRVRVAGARAALRAKPRGDEAARPMGPQSASRTGAWVAGRYASMCIGRLREIRTACRYFAIPHVSAGSASGDRRPMRHVPPWSTPVCFGGSRSARVDSGCGSGSPGADRWEMARRRRARYGRGARSDPVPGSRISAPACRDDAAIRRCPSRRRFRRPRPGTSLRCDLTHA